MALETIGTDEMKALSRHIVLPYITDQFYGSNSLFFRLNAANKKSYEGGLHIEAPMMYRGFANGGAYRGLEVLDVSGNETIKNGAWEMQQYYTALAFSGRDLARANTSMAAANIVSTKAEQAKMDLADKLGHDVSRSTGQGASDWKKLAGTLAFVDDGAETDSYANLDRTDNPWINATVDETTADLTLGSLRASVSAATKGGHSTTLIRSRRDQYDRYWTLGVNNQEYPVTSGGQDQILLNAGFTNLLFDNIPWVVDDKTADGPNANNSRIEFLNENVMEIALLANTDFYMRDWIMSGNQDGMTQLILWYGQLICTAPQTQAVMTNVSGLPS